MGLLFRKGTALEALARADTVVLDKTGTLTRGKPTLVRVLPFGLSREEALRLAAALERGSEHPIAKAVLEAAQGLPQTPAEEVRALPGEGVEGRVEGRRLHLGRPGPHGAPWRAPAPGGAGPGRGRATRPFTWRRRRGSSPPSPSLTPQGPRPRRWWSALKGAGPEARPPHRGPPRPGQARGRGFGHPRGPRRGEARREGGGHPQAPGRGAKGGLRGRRDQRRRRLGPGGRGPRHGERHGHRPRGRGRGPPHPRPPGGSERRPPRKAHPAHHLPQLLLGLRLQRGPHPRGRGGPLPLHRPPPQPHAGGGGHEPIAASSSSPTPCGFGASGLTGG